MTAVVLIERVAFYLTLEVFVQRESGMSRLVCAPCRGGVSHPSNIPSSSMEADRRRAMTTWSSMGMPTMAAA